MRNWSSQLLVAGCLMIGTGFLNSCAPLPSECNPSNPSSFLALRCEMAGAYRERQDRIETQLAVERDKNRSLAEQRRRLQIERDLAYARMQQLRGELEASERQLALIRAELDRRQATVTDVIRLRNELIEADRILQGVLSLNVDCYGRGGSALAQLVAARGEISNFLDLSGSVIHSAEVANDAAIEAVRRAKALRDLVRYLRIAKRVLRVLDRANLVAMILVEVGFRVIEDQLAKNLARPPTVRVQGMSCSSAAA